MVLSVNSHLHAGCCTILPFFMDENACHASMIAGTRTSSSGGVRDLLSSIAVFGGTGWRVFLQYCACILQETILFPCSCSCFFSCHALSCKVSALELKIVMFWQEHQVLWICFLVTLSWGVVHARTRAHMYTNFCFSVTCTHVYRFLRQCHMHTCTPISASVSHAHT
jgi:hypothetical protein